jgi:hypothetical protein
MGKAYGIRWMCGKRPVASRSRPNWDLVFTIGAALKNEQEGTVFQDLAMLL